MVALCMAIGIGLVATTSTSSAADDKLHRVTFRDGEQRRTVDAKLIVEAVDGGLLLLGRDGRLWNVTPDNLVEHDATDETFEPFSDEELAAALKTEFGDGFEIVATEHYVICTDAGQRYGKWCGALFERLLGAFRTHWRTRRLGVREPEFPLPAIVFADRERFAEYATRDSGPDTAKSQGYYSMRSNRMILYDLSAGPDSRPARTLDDITRKVMQSPFNVATVVHEATHQIAFNSGLHTRYADNPLWLTEGMAMYFETPDLRSRTGWKTVGQVNPPRLKQFLDYLQNRRKPDSLLTLIASNERFATAETAGDAYAEAWALTHFLIHRKRRLYVDYLKRIAEKKPLIWNEPEDRVKEFEAAFGDDLARLDREFVAYVLSLGRR